MTKSCTVERLLAVRVELNNGLTRIGVLNVLDKQFTTHHWNRRTEKVILVHIIELLLDHSSIGILCEVLT